MKAKLGALVSQEKPFPGNFLSNLTLSLHLVSLSAAGIRKQRLEEIETR